MTLSSGSKDSPCAERDLPAALSAYADGELGPGPALELEAHVRQCPACSERVRLLRAIRASLRRAAPQGCPGALRSRVAVALAREGARRAARGEEQAGGAATPRPFGGRYAAAAAAAAGVALALSASQRWGREPGERAEDQAALASTVVESLLDDLVVQHAQPLPPETTDPEDLPSFDPFVGVPVRRPAFQPFHVDFKGARVHAMRDRRAALLQYMAPGGHRVTVYVFDSRRIPVQDAPGLTRRRVRERPVYVGRINGYSVAAAEQSGVGYALATDLGDDASTRLVLAAMQ